MNDNLNVFIMQRLNANAALSNKNNIIKKETNIIMYTSVTDLEGFRRAEARHYRAFR